MPDTGAILKSSLRKIFTILILCRAGIVPCQGLSS